MMLRSALIMLIDYFTPPYAAILIIAAFRHATLMLFAIAPHTLILPLRLRIPPLRLFSLPLRRCRLLCF